MEISDSWGRWDGGYSTGAISPRSGKLSLMNIHNLYYLTLLFVVLGILACYLFLKTPLGNSVVCMRENDDAGLVPWIRRLFD